MQQIEVSLYQKRFWLEWLLHPSSIAYNTSLIFEMHGELNLKALLYALETFINYYDEGCRSYFSQDATGIKQLIIEHAPLAIDIRKFNFNVDKQIFVEEITSHIFNLTEPPLYKFGLASYSDVDHLLVLNFHHIISDAMSATTFIKIITKLYNQCVISGPLTSHPELLKLADYVKQEHESYSKEKCDLDLKYWQSLLTDANLYLNLPIKRGSHDDVGKSVYFDLDKQTTLQLKHIISVNKTTIFIFLAAIFGTVLLRYSNQQSLVLNYPINMRPRSFRNKTGCFINNVLFKISYTSQQTFKDLLELLTAQRRETRQHQHCSLTDIVMHLREKSILTSREFFNVDFYEAYLGSIPLDLKNLKVKNLMPKQQTLINDLGLAYQPGQDTIQFKFEYKATLFDDDFINGLIEQFNQLIKNVIHNIHLPLGSYPLLTNMDFQKITSKWNQTHVAIDKKASVISQFESIVKQYSSHIALQHQNDVLTYKELNDSANQLAHYLRAIGVRTESFVGIYFDRSVAMIISILAVLKAGAAYIPLDPKYPSARIKHMLSDSKSSLILSQSSYASQLSAMTQQILFIDQTTSNIASQPSTNLTAIFNLTQAAYVIYTSGSTGQPKGVVVSHQSLFNHNQFVKKNFDVTHADKVLQLSTINFDISIEEIFIALTSAATLVLYPDELGLSIPLFQKLIQEEAVTVLDLPTAFWHSWVTELHSVTDLHKLRLVIVGGEQVNHQILSRWNSITDSTIRWINTYGPTEATIITTYFENTRENLNYIPIGKPIANSQVYITDNNLQPVPIGVTGELLIGGVNLARCYLHQPSLTAEKFIPDPFSTVPGSRLYRTGDLARYLKDGNIEYMGRYDQQVKIRGFRIELGEIESALNAHENIRESHVIISQATPQRLAAYLVLKDKNKYQQLLLKKYLASQLPDYMVPMIFIVLDELPLTMNGKVDKKQLPDLELYSLNQQAVMPPKNDIESRILSIWQEVLNQSEISTDVTFFDVGGHSLLLLKAHVKLEKVFQREIPIVHLFQYTTIKSLAGFLSVSSDVPVLTPVAPDNAQKQRMAFERQRKLMANRKHL